LSIDRTQSGPWPVSAIGDLAKIVTGKTPSTTRSEYYGGDIPFVKPGDLDKGGVLDSSEVYLTKEGAAVVPSLPEKSVLVSCIGNMGKTAILGRSASCNQQINAILPADGLVPEYVLQWARTLKPWMEHEASATTIAILNKGRFSAAQIPIPHLNEQRRIVAKIEALQARRQSACDALEAVPPLLVKFRQSVLAAAFRGDLTADWRKANPDVAPVSEVLERLAESSVDVKVRRGVPSDVPLSAIAERFEVPSPWSKVSVGRLLHLAALIDVKDGNHGANHPKAAEFTSAGLPFITAGQVDDYLIDYEGAPKVSGASLTKLRVGFAKENDSILTHKGTVGRTALNVASCVLSPQTTYYRCERNVIDPKYLVYFMSSPQFYQQLEAVMSQTTRNFVPIREQYKTFLFVPPIEEQQEMAKRIASVFSLAEQSENLLHGIGQELSQVDQSILAKAFRGELVPQVENDRQEAVA
jgi:type I restriction enzyme, S subunit